MTHRQQEKRRQPERGTGIIAKIRIKAKSVNCPNKQTPDTLCSGPKVDSETRCLLDSESLGSVATRTCSDHSQFLKDLNDLLSLPTQTPCSKKTRKSSLTSISSGIYNMWKVKRSTSFTTSTRITEEEPAKHQFSATQLWDALVCHLESNVNPGRRRRSFRWYDDCFQGSEAVDCLKHFIEEALGRNIERQQVLTLLSRFASWGVIEPITSPDKNMTFKDSSLYRLTKQHFWRQDEKTHTLKRSASIPSMVVADTEDSGVASGGSSHSNGLEDTVHTVTVEPERDIVVGQHKVLDNDPSNHPTSSEVPCRTGGTHLPDKSHKRYSESRPHKVLSKDQHRQRRKTCHVASDGLSSSKPMGGSCSDLVDRGSQEQKSDDDHTHRTHPVAPSGCHDDTTTHKRPRQHSSKGDKSANDHAHHRHRHASSKDVRRKTSVSKRAYCDLYKKIASSGQFDKSPVAYGDFGALAMKDVLWQHFSCSQDSGFSLFSSGLLQVNNMEKMDSTTDLQIIRYGFV